jgi:hypothetical protein
VTWPRRRTLLLAAGAALITSRAAPLSPVDGGHALRLGQRVVPGDLVFRSGLSMESSAVLAARPHSRFSHVGVAVNSGMGLQIVHALPPAPGFAGGAVLSSWPAFAMAPDVHAIAAFRVAHAEDSERARIADAALQMLGAPFNSALELAPGHGLYCTQLALSAVASADPSIKGYVHPSLVAFLPDPVYLPDSLLDWPGLVEVDGSAQAA